MASLLRRCTLPLAAALTAALLLSASAEAKTSHAGWPQITGMLVMHKADEHGELRGHPTRHNELLGGHGNDVIVAGAGGDVLWGDYKPSGQPETQVDQILGGPGRDFIYASHGTNIISTGGGRDVVHAHFGHGSITCGSASTIVYLSRRGRAGWQLHGCKRISYRTLGY